MVYILFDFVCAICFKVQRGQLCSQRGLADFFFINIYIYLYLCSNKYWVWKNDFQLILASFCQKRRQESNLLTFKHLQSHKGFLFL